MSKMGRPKGTGGTPQKMTKRGVMQLRKKAMVHAEEALQTIVEIMRDEENDANVRLKAANDLLSRGFGTPVSMQVVEKIITDERQTPLDTTQIGQAATEDLQVLAQTLTKYLRDTADEEQVIDVTPELDKN